MAARSCVAERREPHIALFAQASGTCLTASRSVRSARAFAGRDTLPVRDKLCAVLRYLLACKDYSAV